MGVFIGLFCCNLLVPLLILVFGIWMRKRPPKQIGGLFGYRTSMSMKNRQTWQFAHAYCGKLWIGLGAGLIVLSVFAQLAVPNRDLSRLTRTTEILSAVQIAAALLSVWIVERALRKKFDRNGNPKE